MIYEKVLSYQPKHKEGPLQYNLPSHSNGETVESTSQESSSGLLVVFWGFFSTSSSVIDFENI